MKKSTKNNYTDKEMKRYLGALNEIHGENLKAIKEGFDILNRKSDSHTEMIGVLMEDTSIIKNELKRKVDYDEFSSLVKRVRKIEAKI